MKIEVNGMFSFVRPTGDTYAYTKHWFEEMRDVKLPKWEDLKVFGRLEDIRIVSELVTITLTWSSSRWLQFVYWPGYITDLASVPPGFRSFVDNDQSPIMQAAMVHDFCFSTHFVSFKEANKLLREVAIECGMPRCRAWLAWLAVSSRKARRIWEETTDRKAWTLRTAGALAPRRKIGKLFDTLKTSDTNKGEER